MKLSEYLRESLVDADLRPRDKVDCLRLMVDMLVRQEVVRDAADSLTRLLEREKVVSTGIGNGVAIPHAKAADVRGMVIAVARVAAGLDFEALDGQPVYIVFLLLGPPQEAGLHVKLLARIARLVKNSGFLDSLKKAGTGPDLYRALCEEDARHP